MDKSDSGGVFKEFKEFETVFKSYKFFSEKMANDKLLESSLEFYREIIINTEFSKEIVIKLVLDYIRIRCHYKRRKYKYKEYLSGDFDVINKSVIYLLEKDKTEISGVENLIIYKKDNAVYLIDAIVEEVGKGLLLHDEDKRGYIYNVDNRIIYDETEKLVSDTVIRLTGKRIDYLKKNKIYNDKKYILFYADKTIFFLFLEDINLNKIFGESPFYDLGGLIRAIRIVQKQLKSSCEKEKTKGESVLRSLVELMDVNFYRRTYLIAKEKHGIDSIKGDGMDNLFSKKGEQIKKVPNKLINEYRDVLIDCFKLNLFIEGKDILKEHLLNYRRRIIRIETPEQLFKKKLDAILSKYKDELVDSFVINDNKFYIDFIKDINEIINFDFELKLIAKERERDIKMMGSIDYLLYSDYSDMEEWLEISKYLDEVSRKLKDIKKLINKFYENKILRNLEDESKVGRL